MRYLPSKELEGVGFEFPFRFVAQWYDAQADFINGTDLSLFNGEPMYSEFVDVYEVIPCERKDLLCRGAEMSLWGDRIELKDGNEGVTLSFDSTSAVTVLGRNKLNIYHGDKIYQIRGGKRYNALKYVHIYHRYKNMTRGEGDGKFLGL